MKLLKTGMIACTGLSVLLLVGCTSKIDDKAITAFEESIVEFENIKSASYEFDIDVNVDKDKVNILLDGGFDVQDTPRFDMAVSMESKGETMANAMNIVFDNDVVYMDIMDQKQAISIESLKPMMSSLVKDKDTKLEFDEKDSEELKESLDKASLKDGKLFLMFDTNYIKEKMDEQDNDEFKSISVTSVVLDAIIKDKKMISGKVSVQMQDKDAKESGEFVFKFKLKNINKKVAFDTVSTEAYGTPIDAMQLFGGLGGLDVQ